MATNDLKILAIDDSRDDLRILKAVVSAKLPGATLLTAGDGPEGLELALAEDPDVILLDIVMPRIDGFAVCRMLRDDERLRDTPVVFLTGLGTDSECRVKALEAGAEGFLSKPFENTELTAQVLAMAKIKAANRLQKRQNEQLSALVAERTRELQQELTRRQRAEEERLELERRMLRAQKLESLGVLAGGIAHDFNNLLQTILGNLELAKAELAPGASAGLDLDEATRAANRAADLTRQMLAYSGKGQLVIEEVNLNDLVAESASIFRAAIPRTIDLHIHREPGLPPLLADAAQIQQVMMNLLTNASEAIGQAAGSVSVSTGVMVCGAEYLRRSSLEEKPEPGQFLWFEVTDTGCGMDAGTQQRLFEPFYTTKFTGRGLGLSAVLGIVRALDGAILVDSDLGAGTTIRVLLPVVRREGAHGIEERIAASEADLSRISGPGSVLVVDDEPAIRSLCGKLVKKCGFDVLIAQDGEEAVRVFREHNESILCTFLDLTMPKMGGLPAFLELRRIRPDAKVILCSGYGEEMATDDFAGRGLAGFLQKPYSLTTLRTKLKEVLEGKAGGVS